MSTQPQLEVNLVVKGSFIVGANPNEFEISITNKGEALQLTPTKCLYLKGMLGSGKEDLFLDETDAQKCNKSSPKDWKVLWDFSSKAEGIFRLKIFSFKKIVKDQALTISFSNVISKTDPDGEAALSFETGFSDAKQALGIPKTANRPDIISFYSSPPEGVQNLPGEKVTLKWRTFKLTDRALIQAGRSDPLPCKFDQDEGSKIIRVSDTDINFRLQGYGESRPIFRELQIKALGSGWHDIINTVWEGDPGYPIPETEIETEALKENEGLDLEPTLLLNADNVCLYGIFRREFEGQKKAFLFQTENPFGGWNFVKSSVPDDQSSSIPEGFATSPGVYFDNKLWLIGGSQIDQQKTSRGVWCFDPTQTPQKIWQQCREADWPARMGHAVLVFQNKIWVMGGRDEAGNALNDVWTLDAGKPEWTRVNEKSWNSGRCLINPVVFEEKIWLYGGAAEPSSAELYDDLYICSPVSEGNYKWEKQESLTGAITGTGEKPKKPIASCLQVLGGKLHLFGKFRTTAQDKSRFDEALGFCLSDPSTGTWERFPSDGLGTWGTYTTYSYQAVNFKRMLIAKALPASNRDPNPILKVYVPG